MIKKNKSKWVLLFSFSIFILLMGLWPYLYTFFPSFDSHRIIGLIAAIVFGMFMYFDKRLDSIGVVDGDNIKFGNLSEILLASLKDKGKTIRTLDIFAFTTGVIMPIVSNSGVNIDNIRVIVIDPDKAEEVMAGYRSEVHQKVKSWKSIRNNKELKIRFYDQMPSDYFLLINDITIVMGTYSLVRDDISTPVEIFYPIKIDQSDDLSKNIISSYKNRFDSLWRYCEKNAPD